MASLAEMRTAIKSTLDAAFTAASLNCNVYAKAKDLPIPLCVVITPADVDFDGAMGRGLDTWTFNLVVLAASADVEVAQTELDPLVTGAGTTSIRQIIFNAPSLGLSYTDAHVAAMTGYGNRYDVAGGQRVGASMRLVVHTRGSA